MKLNYVKNRDFAVYIKNSLTAVNKIKAKENIFGYAIRWIFLYLCRLNRQKALQGQ